MSRAIVCRQNVLGSQRLDALFCEGGLLIRCRHSWQHKGVDFWKVWGGQVPQD